jgi:hypothetical protein
LKKECEYGRVKLELSLLQGGILYVLKRLESELLKDEQKGKEDNVYCGTRTWKKLRR